MSILKHLGMEMELLSGFGYRNRESFRIRIWELTIFQESDIGTGDISGLGYGIGASFRMRRLERSIIPF